MIRELKIAIIQSKNVFKGEITVKFWLVPLQNFQSEKPLTRTHNIYNKVCIYMYKYVSKLFKL